MFPYVIRQGSTFEQLHNKIDKIVKDYYLKQAYYVLVLGLL